MSKGTNDNPEISGLKSGVHPFNGGKIINNVETYRLRCEFDSTPSTEVRDALNEKGWRWSSTAGAWGHWLSLGGLCGIKEALAINPDYGITRDTVLTFTATEDAPPTSGHYTVSNNTVASLVHRFNNLTHYPTTVERIVGDWAAYETQVRDATTQRLTRYGVTGVPSEVEAAIVRLLDAYNGYFAAQVRSRELAPPWNVTGRANYNKVFTERKQNRAHSIIEKANEAIEAAKKGLDRALMQYSPNRAISSDDPNAIAAIQEKLDNKVALQEKMKAANLVIRNKKISDEERYKKLMELLGINYEAAKAFCDPGNFGGPGFPSYRLTNNNSEINRLKGRIVEIERKRADVTGVFEFTGGKIIDNVEENRLQIEFDARTSKDVYNALKGRGFRWSPTNNAFQQYRSTGAVWSAKYALASDPQYGVTMDTEITFTNPDDAPLTLPDYKANFPVEPDYAPGEMAAAA